MSIWKIQEDWQSIKTNRSPQHGGCLPVVLSHPSIPFPTLSVLFGTNFYELQTDLTSGERESRGKAGDLSEESKVRLLLAQLCVAAASQWIPTTNVLTCQADLFWGPPCVLFRAFLPPLTLQGVWLLLSPGCCIFHGDFIYPDHTSVNRPFTKLFSN